MIKKEDKTEQKIMLVNIEKVGFVHLHGLENYQKKHDIELCFFITPVKPFDNVLNYAKKIDILEIIISANFQKEHKKIIQKYTNAEIISINPYQLAGRDGMLDGA